MFLSIITSDMKMDIIIAMKWCQNYHKVLSYREILSKTKNSVKAMIIKKIIFKQIFTIHLAYIDINWLKHNSILQPNFI